MAFDINLPDKTGPDFLNFSRGSTADTSVGTALKGAADLLEMGVKGTDNAIKSNIETRIQDHVDETRDAFGVGTKTELSDLNQKGLAEGTPPAAVQRGLDKLERTGRAAAAGKIKDSDYWARINTEVRRLRASWPGYRDYIDSAASKVAGTNPANALRSAMQREAEAVDSSGKDALNFKKWLVSQSPQAAEAYLNAERAGTPMSTDAAIMLTSKYKAEESNLDMARKRFAFKKDIREEDIEENRGTVVKDIQTTASAHMKAEHSNFPILEGDVSSLSKADPEKMNKTVVGLKIGKQKLIQKLSNLMNTDLGNGKTWGAYYGKDPNVQAAISQAVAQYDMTLDLLEKGDINGIKVMKDTNDHISQVHRNQALKDPEIAKLNVLAGTAGPVAASFYLSQTNKEGKSPLDSVSNFQLNMTMSAVEGGVPLNKTFDHINSEGVNRKANAESARAILWKIDKTISDPNAPPEKILSLHNALMGDEFAIGSKRLTARDRSVFYDKMSSPQYITSYLKATASDPEARAKFSADLNKAWIIQNRDIIKDARDLNMDNRFATIKYDDKTQSFAINRSDLIMTDPKFPKRVNDSFGDVERRQVGLARLVVDKLNSRLEGLKTFAKGVGASPEKLNELVKTNLMAGGFEPDSPSGRSGGSLFHAVTSQFKEYFTGEKAEETP